MFFKNRRRRIRVQLNLNHTSEIKDKECKPNHGNDVPCRVAIIGMAGRFPGASDIDELMTNIYGGVESITFFKDSELDPSFDNDNRRQPNYIKARNIITDIDKFDAEFFGISPRIAEVMDPQQRVFMETSWAALENAGYDPQRYPGKIGIYAGMGYDTYIFNNVLHRHDLSDAVGDFQTMLGNDKDFLPTLIAYKFNLTGPAVNINTACSTSLVAVNHAYYSLMTNQCDIALAGGVSITVPQESGYLYLEGAMLSKDGHTRSFDSQSSGTIFGNGAGAVVLKRLEDAAKDGDYIYAVILGVGLNNDGINRASFTAPSVSGQIEVIQMAQKNANISPDTISYVEAHGTATPLGDPIEIEALTRAFRKNNNLKGYCAIGSIKTNIGHTVAASGVAGLIKTARCLNDKLLAPSLFFEKPNPEIDFANSPFFVNTRLSEWKTNDTPRRAGVSSFGVGGTNAHTILEEAPTKEPTGPSRPYQLLLLSAKTETALERNSLQLANYFQTHPDVNLADTAFTLQVGRQSFSNRRIVVCRDSLEAVSNLKNLSTQRGKSGIVEQSHSGVVFMFPGQGSQYVNMGLNLYEHEPLFRNCVDQCANILTPFLQCDLREILYPKAETQEEASARLRETSITQPALFTIEYALAKLWMSWGIFPSALIGHSIGEFTAACLAEVFSLEDALKLVAKRGHLMQELPSGDMISVNLPANQLEKRLNNQIAIAAINGPSLCVASGPREAIHSLQQELEHDGIVCLKLHTSHAFHSPMMDSIIEPFSECVKNINLSEPVIPILSTVTADWLTAQQSTDPMYWGKHLRETVHFADGVASLWKKQPYILLEAGPRSTCATLARQQAVDKKKYLAIPSLGDNAADQAEWSFLLNAVGNLWLAGISIDLEKFYSNEKRNRIPLPTYSFERTRHWADRKDVSININDQKFTSTNGAIMTNIPGSTSQKQSRKEALLPILLKLFEDVSGLNLNNIETSSTFVEIGVDSLTLTQISNTIQQKMNTKVTFRQLIDDLSSFDTLAEYLDQQLPPNMYVEAPSPIMTPEVLSLTVNAPTLPINPIIETNPNNTSNILQTTIQTQLQIMAQQLALLSGQQISTPLASSNSTNNINPNIPPLSGLTAQNVSSVSVDKKNDEYILKKSILPGPIQKKRSGDLTANQKSALNLLITQYTNHTPKSKEFAQKHRSYLADPRTVAGFTPLLKEIVYPIVVDRSLGSKLWDIDGNEYIDLLNGFGSNFFGYSPAFLKDAMKTQLEKGIEIGPQTQLAGEVAQLITELVHLERVTFCNTGSEAVMGAIRIARAVTGRNLIVLFSESYHGLNDEVIVRGTQQLRSIPGASGIPSTAVENILVLDYDTPEALDIIRQRSQELAAVLVEPIQSRRPDIRPKQFLSELRKICDQSGSVLIFDEVVTGFRIHLGGAQALFNIEADLATYGKVIGGGLPLGIIAGKSKYMDVLDGGFWQFGDDSFPTTGATYFAGTFMRHPLVLASAKASLEYLKNGGTQLQENLNLKADQIAAELNDYFKKIEVPLKVDNFGSMMKLTFTSNLPYGELLYSYLRINNLHIWDHRPFFITLAHSNEDIEIIIKKIKSSVEEMQKASFFPRPNSPSSLNNKSEISNTPPVPGARLGRDPQGNPQWFVPDPVRAGKFIQIESTS